MDVTNIFILITIILQIPGYKGKKYSTQQLNLIILNLVLSDLPTLD